MKLFCYYFHSLVTWLPELKVLTFDTVVYIHWSVQLEINNVSNFGYVITISWLLFSPFSFVLQQQKFWSFAGHQLVAFCCFCFVLFILIVDLNFGFLVNLVNLLLFFSSWSLNWINYHYYHSFNCSHWPNQCIQIDCVSIWSSI